MSFVPKGRRSTYFRHKKGDKGERCRNTIYSPPMNNRTIEKLRQTVKGNCYFSIVDNKYNNDEKRLSSGNVTAGRLRGDPESDNDLENKEQSPYYKDDETEFTLDELLNMLINKVDFSNKFLRFHGETKRFNEAVVDLNDIDEQLYNAANTSHIYWGRLHNCDCKNKGKTIKNLDDKAANDSEYQLYFYSGECNREKPVIILKPNSSRCFYQKIWRSKKKTKQ